MEKLRNDPPAGLGGLKVTQVSDYQTGEAKLKLPKSNVLYFDLENDAWCCARPSGTEPKIKFYIGVKGSSIEDADSMLDRIDTDLMALAQTE